MGNKVAKEFFTEKELETAFHWFGSDRTESKDEKIAFTCIGIVMEMLKTKESTITDYEWLVGKTEGNITAKTAGGKIIIAKGVSSLTRPHIVGLHEIWRKVCSIFPTKRVAK